MSKDDSIILIKNYGKINIKLKEVILDRNISRNYLARAINTRFEVVNKWYSNNVEKIDADILARMCFVLNCKVSDIVEYTAQIECDV